MSEEMDRKVRHVLAAHDTGNHHCHWPGCTELCKPAYWGCRRHWFRLPKHLRDRIWATYRPGQERDKCPSDEYIQAAQAVQEWIAQFQRLSQGG